MSSILSNIPSLHLRKDIWSHFPVCLIRLPVTTDGRDRYAIQWHKKNLIEWSQGIPQYSVITQIRLLKALKTCDKWTLEPAQDPADLCVIAMRVPESPRKFERLPDLIGAAKQSDLRIQDLDDLRAYLPVCWKSRNNRHTLEYHNTQVRALAEDLGITELEVRNLTYHTLVQLVSDNWMIHMTNKLQSQEICTLTAK
jgi:hypothetical protein